MKKVMDIDREHLREIIKHKPDFFPTFYVDVDGTLLGFDQSVIQVTVDFIKDIKKEFGEKIEVVAWSSGGKVYTEQAVDKCGIREYVDYIISKPFCIVDDLMENCLAYTRCYISPYDELVEQYKCKKDVKPEEVF